MQMLVYKAADLGMRLSAAFKSDNGILFTDINSQTFNVHRPPKMQYSSMLQGIALQGNSTSTAETCVKHCDFYADAAVQGS